MGTGTLFFGFLFLINPELITLDLIPDLFGYLLIAKGLEKLSHLEERVAAGRRYAFLLALSSLIKFAANGITFSTQIESTRLTVTFFFFLAEIFLGFLLVDHVFKGVQYLAVRRDGDLALKGYEVARLYLTAFFLVKPIATFLPQTAVIFFPNVDADPELVEGFTSMVRTFRTARSILFAVGALVLVFFGIYTARILKAYVARCRSDEVFCTNLEEDYKEKVSCNESMQKRLAIRKGFLFFFVASVFLGDWYLDHLNMFPRPLFALFVCLGLWRIREAVKVKSWQISVSVGTFVITLIGYAYRIFCLLRDDWNFPYSFPGDPIAVVLGILGTVSCAVLVCLMLFTVKRCCETYTEQRYGNRFVILCILFLAILALGFYRYLFVGRYLIEGSIRVDPAAVEWCLYALALFLHKNSLEDIRNEADWKLI